MDTGTVQRYNTMEQTAVVIHTNTCGEMLVVSGYVRSGQLRVRDLWTVFGNTILPTILAGDLNAERPEWNSRTANINGDGPIWHAVRAGLLVRGPEESTFQSYGGRYPPDVLDIAVFKDFPCRAGHTRSCRLHPWLLATCKMS
jgi:hypothetical protein